MNEDYEFNRNPLSTLASSSSQLKRDVKKIIDGYRKVGEDWRSILRADYLMMLKTIICIKSEFCVLRLRSGEVWIGRLAAIDSDHMNVILLEAQNVNTGLKVNKALIRGDQVELILHLPNREQAIKASRKVLIEKL